MNFHASNYFDPMVFFLESMISDRNTHGCIGSISITSFLGLDNFKNYCNVISTSAVVIFTRVAGSSIADGVADGVFLGKVPY